MIVRRVALLLALAGCGQVIGIRELGVEVVPAGASGVDGAAPDGPKDGGAETSATPEVDACSAPNMAGRWRGVFTAMVGGTAIGFTGGTGNSEAEITQACGVLTGSVTINGCTSFGRLTGTIAADGSFDGTITAGDIVVLLERVTLLEGETKLGGVFEIPAYASGCYAQSGVIDLRRE